MKSIAFTIAAILANTLPRWVIGIDGDLFCKWQAFSFVLMAVAGKLKTVEERENIWWDYCAVLAVNNWIDEARNHAKQIDGIEIVFAIAATIWLIYRLIKCRTKTNN